MMERTAVISPCGTYRYRLGRRWADGPTCLFIMLNPSTADANIDDRTIGRCVGFAKREECGALEVVNLMAFRATDPGHLPDDRDTACGPDNFDTLVEAIRVASGPVIVAWGANSKARSHVGSVAALAALMGKPLYALKITKSGAPGHPLYVKADAPLVLLQGTEAGQ